MQEDPFFLENSGRRLFCIQYTPPGPVRGGLVLCHPFAEEKLWAQRVFVSCARFLARNGYGVLRVDYMGHGDSEGEFSDATLETRISDIGRALDHLKGGLAPGTPLGLLGLRLGATLAAIFSDRRADLSFLVLWEPIVDGNAYLRQLLRINIATQTAVYKQILHTSEALVEKLARGETINIDGYEIGNSFYRQLSGINLLEGPRVFSGPVMIASIVPNPEKLNRQLLSLKQKYPDGHYCTVVEKAFWNNVPAYCREAAHLNGQTLNWLEGMQNDSRQN